MHPDRDVRRFLWEPNLWEPNLGEPNLWEPNLGEPAPAGDAREAGTWRSIARWGGLPQPGPRQ
jgi:hypothetical protein